ncbi:class I SAM-dependent methyltransferase [Saccharopolyspora phatthalungensis]|uniref:SAM-dependent methyltransferase n=1 Tax=Saccharopolyspora phatthalungensis TaxID=664693 RepID=A0A840QEB4_9PSEU|nr:class I SAM-dependent methyltransferase [Saccharopolyspora phatthalungensis]MBB5157018.1 SAM-dependent methyltransferase [Saccharopolyspora phatthalungensis]
MSESFEFPGKYYEIIRRDYRNLEEETQFLASYLPDDGHVLDLGCGTGTNLRALRGLGKKYTLLGVDQSQSFIDYANSAGNNNIRYVRGKLDEYETNDQFNLIYSLFVRLNYLRHDQMRAVLNKVSSWLRPDGIFVVDVSYLLQFVENYQPYITAHHKDDRILITRFIRHSLNAHEGNWRHEETMLVREQDGQLSMYENFFDQTVITAPELRRMLQEAGLKVVETFRNFRKDPPFRGGQGSLIFVASKA